MDKITQILPEQSVKDLISNVQTLLESYKLTGSKPILLKAWTTFKQVFEEEEVL
jgi:hypothetical protein